MSTPIDLLAGRLAGRAPVEIELAPAEQAAIAVILSTAGGAGPELLLIQRAEREGDPWSGHMALPGGRRDPADLDLSATAVRETREEIGVELGSARLLGRLDDLLPIRLSRMRLAVRPFVYCVERRPELSLGDEVAGALWVPLATLRARAGETRVIHRGEALQVEAYLVEQRVVWGLTQRVLADLLRLAE